MGHHHHRHHEEIVCEPFLPVAGLFAPGGVGFWVFLLILALLGISWAQGALGTATA